VNRLMGHLKGNLIAYLALFIALGGTGYAVSKVGPQDIERNAIRKKHVKRNAIRAEEIKRRAVRSAEIANGQVQLGDLNRGSVAARFGAGLYFGQASGFGPVASNTGSEPSVPIIGSINFDLSVDTEGGASILLAPIPVRARDLRMRTLNPVERTVRIQVLRVAELVDEPILTCTIQSGQNSCASTGISETLGAGERLGLRLNAPIEPGTLQEHSYDYALRIIPG
jgi:hypothetical protein